jgi:hypothetical protein
MSERRFTNEEWEAACGAFASEEERIETDFDCNSPHSRGRLDALERAWVKIVEELRP